MTYLDPKTLRKAADAVEGLRTFERTYSTARSSAQISENVGLLAAAEYLRRMADEAGKGTPAGGELTRAQPVPRTERSYWQDITDALNAAGDAGMPVGIDLDGTLTDHRAWSVVWDRESGRWALTGYADDETGGAQ